MDATMTTRSYFDAEDVMALDERHQFLIDLYRAGLKSAADLMKTSLESAERLQNQQLIAIRTAIVDSGKSVAELTSARTLDELLAAQNRVAGAQFERALSLWSDWLAAASENQREAMQRVQESARSWLAQASKAGEPRN